MESAANSHLENGSYTNREIADKIGKSEPTVERKLNLIANLAQKRSNARCLKNYRSNDGQKIGNKNRYVLLQP